VDSDDGTDSGDKVHNTKRLSIAVQRRLLMMLVVVLSVAVLVLVGLRCLDTFHRYHLSAFRPRGVPGPTSKLSLRVPAQMGRHETEHKGGKGNRGSCCPAPRADALAVGGYKRSRGRERACSSARPPVRPPSRTRALDLPFIDVRRRPRCTMGGVAMC
jgi:hypothetical protein